MGGFGNLKTKKKQSKILQTTNEKEIANFFGILKRVVELVSFIRLQIPTQNILLENWNLTLHQKSFEKSTRNEVGRKNPTLKQKESNQLLHSNHCIVQTIQELCEKNFVNSSSCSRFPKNQLRTLHFQFMKYLRA